MTARYSWEIKSLPYRLSIYRVSQKKQVHRHCLSKGERKRLLAHARLNLVWSEQFTTRLIYSSCVAASIVCNSVSNHSPTALFKITRKLILTRLQNLKANVWGTNVCVNISIHISFTFMCLQYVLAISLQRSCHKPQVNWLHIFFCRHCCRQLFVLFDLNSASTHSYTELLLNIAGCSLSHRKRKDSEYWLVWCQWIAMHMILLYPGIPNMYQYPPNIRDLWNH